MSRSPLLLVGLLLTLASSPAPRCQAPAGFRTVSNKLSGITFCYPTTYGQVPLKPTEKVLVAKYVRKKMPRQLKSLKLKVRGLEPTILVFRYERRGPVTGGSKQVVEKQEEGKEPRSLKEAYAAANKIYSFADFKEKRLGRYKVVPVAGCKGHYRLQMPPLRFQGGIQFEGYLVVRTVDDHDLGVYGFTLTPHLKSFTKTIKTMARCLDLTRDSRTRAGEKKLDRLYRSGKYRAVEKRKALRRTLAKGWKAVDTENFIMLHNSPNTRLVAKISRDVEAMRTVYAAAYPPAGKIDALGIIRVCRTNEEYHQYGGPSGSGGYWNHGTEELVFFDYSLTMRKLDARVRRKMVRKLSNKDSMLVLYHESFHQYIYYALGNFSPHYWFNEGTAEYYSGAVIPSGSRTVSRIGPAPWRMERARVQCREGKGFVPLKKLLYAERPEFYHPRYRSDYYAAAWSFIWFLREAPQVRENPRWAGLLSAYYKELQGYSLAFAKDKKAQEMSLEGKMELQVAIRREVMDKVLKGIDLAKLEVCWKEFIADSKDLR